MSIDFKNKFYIFLKNNAVSFDLESKESVNKECFKSKTVNKILTIGVIKAYNYNIIKSVQLLLFCGGDFKCLFL